MKKFGKKLAASLLVAISSISLAFGVSACTSKNNNPSAEVPAGTTTDRAEVPTDGSKPADHTALENIAYMSYVLDHQPFYHAYAYNSSKSSAVEQITRSWKDYKSAELSGVGSSIMVATDISYSTFVKASTQSCFVGNTDAYMRSGSKPGSKTTPTEVNWSGDAPTYYDKNSHLVKYGEFSTELSVFSINSETLISASEVKDNENGTYSQTFNLNADAACYYKYGMKTRGGLKEFPAFSKIEITFTFDGNWQVLGSVCNEVSTMKPGALGGMTVSSVAKTQTTFDYSEEGFDKAHYAYFEDYFKDYLGKTDMGGGSEACPDILTVLGNGFGKVLDPDCGQQFTVDITLGETYYTGKIFLRLDDMNDIVGSLDVRVELAREDGNPDLYIEFKNGAVNVYYSDSFALTADIGKVSTSVSALTEWIKGLGKVSVADVAEVLSEGEESGGFDLNSLLSSLEHSCGDTSSYVKLKTHDLLGLGIGLNVQLYFDRTKDADGGDAFSFSSMYLNSVSYNSEAINVSGMIFPDNSPAISRNPSDTPADIADYIDGVTKLLESNSYLVNINLDGTAEIEYINGLELSANAQVELKDGYNEISVNVPVEVDYNGLTVKLSAYYTINLENGDYGDIYLYVSQIGNKEVDVKVCCNIAGLVDEVKAIIGYFGKEATPEVQSEETQTTVASVINAVLALDFSELITDLKADNENISVGIDVDKILEAVNVDPGVQAGKLTLGLNLDENGKASVSGGLTGLGLTASIAGSDTGITVPDLAQYGDLTLYIKSVEALLESNSYLVNINLDGTAEIEYVNGLELSANAQVELKDGYNEISVNVPVDINYNGLTVKLSAYYTINLENGDYGDIYLYVSQIGNKEVDVKVCCNIAGLVDEVKAIIDYFDKDKDEKDENTTPSVQSEQSDTVAKVIETVLGLDFAKLITDLKADNENISIGVDVDKILEAVKVDLGVQAGVLALGIKLEDGKAVLSGGLTGLGLTASIAGSDTGITVPDLTEYADITQYINGVEALLASSVYTLDINLNGNVNTDNTVAKYLEGVTADAHAQVQLGEDLTDIKVYLPVNAEYKGLTVSLEAYYTVNFADGGFGEIYLVLTQINGKEFSAKATCGIEELKECIENLIALIKGEDGGTEEDIDTLSGNSGKIAGIIEKIISLDFAKIINELTANSTGVKLNVNADEILGALNIDAGDIKVGSVSLDLGLEDGVATLSGNVPEYGLSLTLGGADGAVNLPQDKDNYLDLVALVQLVTAAYEEADKIINAQDINFNLNTTVTVDGIAMTVNAEGEVIWTDGAIRVAVSAELIIADTSDESGEKYNTLYINFIYDETQETFIRMTVNGLGLEINNSNIEEVKGGVTEIIANVKNLISLFTPADGEENLVAPDADSYSLENINESVYAEIVNTVLGLLGNVTVCLDKDLIINYATDGTLSLNADGGLGLNLRVNINGAEAVALTASVNAGNLSRLSALNEALDGEEYTFYTDENSFVRAVYEYIFDLFENLPVDKILGSGTYTVKVNIAGGESGIDALDGINVAANLYYTDKNVSNGKKLVQAELDLDISGTTVKADVYLSDRTLYVALNEVAGTVLSDIAFKAATDDIYSAVETLIKVVSSDTLIQIISKITGNTVQAEAAATALEQEKTSSALTEVLTNLLSLDFASIINYEKVDGVNIYTIEPDSIIELFGADVKVGTVKLEINPETHSIYASVTNGESAWLTLDAQVVENSAHGTFSPDEKYMDIGFIPNLLEDVLATAESFKDEEGNVNIIYSLKGTIKADIKYSVISGTIEFKDTVLTVGLDENDEFYLSLTARLENSKAKLTFIDTVNITSAGSVSVTYSNGYLTLGRNGVYKVMTFDYFLDNALNSTVSDSPAGWLLGTNGTAWSLLSKNLPLSLSSGLTEPQSIGLYELAEAAAESAGFSISSLISGFEMNSNGKKTNYNTCNAVSEIRKQLGLSGNYYAFDINAGSLTGGVISTLYAAILSGENGISGIKAITNVGGAVDLYVNLGSRSETNAPDFYKTVTAEHEIDFNYSQSAGDHRTNVFGCYDTSSGYSYTPVLDSVKLNVIDFNGETTSYELRYGSTVYLTSLWAPEWTDDGKSYTVIYKDLEGNEVGTEYTDSENNVLGKLLVLDDTLFGTVEGEMQYTLVIVKAEGTTPEKEITYHLKGVDGIEEVNAAFALSGDGVVSLIKYSIDGYLMLGWYTDEDCTQAIDEETAKAFEGNDVYCEYIKSTTIIGGVVYKLYEENGEYVYHVSGTDAGSIAAYSNGKILVLENEIILGGVTYRVTAIDENALKDANLKNVVVPENITLVYKNAFSDNYGIQSVVFLAQSVGLEGKKSDKTYPFYGCSDTDGGETTSLKVYYTSIYSVEDSSATDWSHFRHSDGFIGIGSKDYYIQSSGGALISANWTYVEYTFNRFATDLTELTNGAATTAYTQQQIESYVTGVLNSLTCSNGYINAYSVEVSGGTELNNSRCTVTVTITDLPATEWWYALTVQSAVSECSVSYTIPEELYTDYNGAMFVKAGTQINISSAGDEFGIFEFDGWTGTDAIENAQSRDTTLSMPTSKIDVTATWSADFAENTYVTSETAFYYNGVKYNAGENVNITNAAIDTKLAIPTPVGNYVFLGWAVEANGAFTFINSETTVISEAEAHYYAIWAANHLNDADYSVATEGSLPTAPTAKTGYSGTFHKWYADAAFTQEIDALSTTATVLYSRMQYSFTYNLSGNGDTYFYDNVAGDDSSLTKNNRTAEGKSYSNTISVLEGANVSFAFENSDHTLIITVGDETITLRAKKKGGWPSYTAGDMRTFSSGAVTLEGDGWTNTSVTVSGDIAFTVPF